MIQVKYRRMLRKTFREMKHEANPLNWDLASFVVMFVSGTLCFLYLNKSSKTNLFYVHDVNQVDPKQLSKFLCLQFMTSKD